jgi:hypothetical protein
VVLQGAKRSLFLMGTKKICLLISLGLGITEVLKEVSLTIWWRCNLLMLRLGTLGVLGSKLRVSLMPMVRIHST